MVKPLFEPAHMLRAEGPVLNPTNLCSRSHAYSLALSAERWQLLQVLAFICLMASAKSAAHGAAPASCNDSSSSVEVNLDSKSSIKVNLFCADSISHIDYSIIRTAATTVYGWVLWSINRGDEGITYPVSPNVSYNATMHAIHSDLQSTISSTE